MRVRGQSARRVFDTVISIQEDPICKSITSPFFRLVHLFYVYCRIIFLVKVSESAVVSKRKCKFSDHIKTVDKREK